MNTQQKTNSLKQNNTNDILEIINISNKIQKKTINIHYISRGKNVTINKYCANNYFKLYEKQTKHKNQVINRLRKKLLLKKINKNIVSI